MWHRLTIARFGTAAEQMHKANPALLGDSAQGRAARRKVCNQPKRSRGRYSRRLGRADKRASDPAGTYVRRSTARPAVGRDSRWLKALSMSASHSPESSPNEPISQVTVTSLEAQQAELLALLQSLTTGSDEPFKVQQRPALRQALLSSLTAARTTMESRQRAAKRALCRWSCSS